MMYVTFHPPDRIMKISGQGSQQLRKQGLTKISLYENFSVHTNIKVVTYLLTLHGADSLLV
jgi:hypothetical protein